MAEMPQTIKVVHKSGQNHGALNSLNIISTTHNKDALTKNPKNPRVIIRKGSVRMSSRGFMKKFKSPKIIPKSRIISQF